jgi:DNA-binding MarR family transcriptional regulator
MSLIEKFENMLKQNVGTFNSIFTHTPIMGIPFDTDVEIRGVCPGGLRLVKVGDSVMHLDLSAKKTAKKPQKEKVERRILSSIEVSSKKLPSLYRTLKPTEFMVYSAIKELGYIIGVTKLAEQLNLNSKTILTNLPRLVKLGLVTREKVVTDKGNFYKLVAN